MSEYAGFFTVILSVTPRKNNIAQSLNILNIQKGLSYVHIKLNLQPLNLPIQYLLTINIKKI